MPGRGRTSWRALTATSAAVVLLVVGGCSRDEGAAPEPSRSTAPAEETPAPTPTPTEVAPPEQPAAMAEPTTDGAIAAATYVLALYDYAYASGDAGPWDAITLDSCTFCVGVAESVSEMVAAGHVTVGEPFRVETAQSVEISEDRWFSVDMNVVQPPSRGVDQSGATVNENPGGRFRAVFALSWDLGWRVDEMGFEALDESTAPLP
ncbi:DUF6318 family protein [Cellulomonas sp. JZ18]|uniref:DUF6318 family protein n=1 Tax=Cellulomonas sp. JZ18 TaxID=2654191 RepID=UPI001E3E454B|nr:DUF6318 family protein [Cellulomonas sp. JZ18]